MPVSKVTTIDEIEPGNYKITWPDPLNIPIRDILSTPNVFFTETSVQVSERLFLNFIVNEPKFVDVDFNWPIPHRYIGNYQLATWNGLYPGSDSHEGFITSTTTIIEKRSAITIVADPNELSTIEGNLKLEQCNFQLVPELKIFPPVVTPVLSYQIKQPDPVFEGFLQRIPPKLQSTVYQPQISEARVKTRMGCQLATASYVIAPINNVFIAEPTYTLPVCNLPENLPCQTQFDNYVLQINNNQPIDTAGGEVFSTNLSCKATWGPSDCQQEVFTCTDGDTRQYWKPNLN